MADTRATTAAFRPFRKHGERNTLVTAMKTERYLENKSVKDMLSFCGKICRTFGLKNIKEDINSFKRGIIFLDIIAISQNYSSPLTDL